MENVLSLLITSVVSSGHINKPTLVTNNQYPTDGDSITLTCNTTTTGVTNYEFRKGSQVVANQLLNTHTIDPATIDAHDGNYSCIAFVDSVASPPSDPNSVTCKSSF